MLQEGWRGKKRCALPAFTCVWGQAGSGRGFGAGGSKLTMRESRRGVLLHGPVDNYCTVRLAINEQTSNKRQEACWRKSCPPTFEGVALSSTHSPASAPSFDSPATLYTTSFTPTMPRPRQRRGADAKKEEKKVRLRPNFSRESSSLTYSPCTPDEA